MGRRAWLALVISIALVTGCTRIAPIALGTVGAVAAGRQGQVAGFIMGLVLGLAVDYGISKAID